MNSLSNVERQKRHREKLKAQRKGAINVYLPRDVLDSLNYMCQGSGKSQSEVIAWLVMREFDSETDL